MEQKIYPPHETRYSDLIGAISINLGDKSDFNSLATSLAHYDPERFEAIALRVYHENGGKPIVTLFALDKTRRDGISSESKIPVHKFKMEMSFEELFTHLKSFNFTVTTGDYKIDHMEVINK